MRGQNVVISMPFDGLAPCVRCSMNGGARQKVQGNESAGPRYPSIFINVDKKS